jgi:hypothetical protein
MTQSHRGMGGKPRFLTTCHPEERSDRRICGCFSAPLFRMPHVSLLRHGKAESLRWYLPRHNLREIRDPRKPLQHTINQP